MRYEKLGILALKCKEYALACGKRSILKTKPVKRGNFYFAPTKSK